MGFGDAAVNSSVGFSSKSLLWSGNLKRQGVRGVLTQEFVMDELTRAAQVLEKNLDSPDNYARLFEDIAARLAARKRPIPAFQLLPLLSTIEGHLATCADRVDLENFRRVSRGLYYLWQLSGRDLVLTSLTEIIARRFGQLLDTVNIPLAAIDNSFNDLFFMAFKSAPNWHEAMAWLNPQLIEPYFRYLDRVHPVPSLPFSAQKSERNRIGYLVWSLEVQGSFAIGRMLYSIMRGHAAADPDTNIYIYSSSRASSKSIAAFAGLPNVKLRELYLLPSLEEKALTIAHDSLDALIMEGCSAESFRLMQKRMVGRQFYMPLGMHPMTAPFFDGYLIYENMAQNAFKLGVPRDRASILPWTLDSEFLNPERTARELYLGLRYLPKGKPIFATFCRMEKITNQVLFAMAEVLRRVPEAGLLLAGPNDNTRIRDFFSRQGLAPRISVPGSVDPHAIHPYVDVFLDTFPMCGGLAPVEAMAKGVPVVFLSDIGTESSCSLRDPTLSAANIEDYVELSVRLASDPAFLASRRASAFSIAARVSSIVESSRIILQHLKARRTTRSYA